MSLKATLTNVSVRPVFLDFAMNCRYNLGSFVAVNGVEIAAKTKCYILERHIVY